MQIKNNINIIIFLIFSITILEADFIRDASKKIVIDTSTNLIWQDDNDVVTITKNWTDTITYCEALTLGGLSWHLPNWNELYMLADRSRKNPSIDPIFSNTAIENYWSSTTDPDTTTKAWYVYFGSGQDLPESKSTSFHVRCVHVAD